MEDRLIICARRALYQPPPLIHHHRRLPPVPVQPMVFPVAIFVRPFLCFNMLEAGEMEERFTTIPRQLN